ILLLRGRTLTVVTVLNVITIGWWMDRFSAWGLVPYVDGWPGLLFLAAGIVVMGFGVALYLHPGQGAGPRDGLMVTLHERTGQPLYRIKMALALPGLAAGGWLGGRVAMGTVMLPFGLGPVFAGFGPRWGRWEGGGAASKPAAGRNGQ